MPRHLALLVFPFTFPSLARACTVCDSEIGIAVRAGVFNESFLLTFLEVVAPFPVLGLAIFAIHRYLPD